MGLRARRLFLSLIFGLGIVLAGSGVTSQSAQAAPSSVLTTETLYNWCSAAANLSDDINISPVEAMKAGYCTGFMKGYSLALFAFEVICIENQGLQTGVLIESFLEWAEANPELRDRDAEFGVTAALEQRLSCNALSKAAGN